MVENSRKTMMNCPV